MPPPTGSTRRSATPTRSGAVTSRTWPPRPAPPQDPRRARAAQRLGRDRGRHRSPTASRSVPTCTTAPTSGCTPAADGRLGFHRAGSHEVVPVDDLVLATPEVQALRDAVGDRTGAAEVRSARTRRPGRPRRRSPPAPDGSTSRTGTSTWCCSSPTAQLALRGDGVLAETVAGLTYRFDTSSFFQVSTGGAEALVTHVLEAVGPVDGALVWDLYAGVGLLSLPLARAGAEVLAVEGHGPRPGGRERTRPRPDLAVTSSTRRSGPWSPTAGTRSTRPTSSSSTRLGPARAPRSSPRWSTSHPAPSCTSPATSPRSPGTPGPDRGRLPAGLGPAARPVPAHPPRRGGGDLRPLTTPAARRRDPPVGSAGGERGAGGVTR
jgi:hypothetical protein